ncbi:MAG: LysR family transcriptional regulator [Umezawaea sp.]
MTHRTRSDRTPSERGANLNRTHVTATPSEVSGVPQAKQGRQARSAANSSRDLPFTQSDAIVDHLGERTAYGGLVNWIDLCTFRAVAEERSFTRASRRLHVSVSAVSQRIRRLERDMRNKLLERTTTTVTLTESGQSVLEAVTAIDRIWETTRRDVTRPVDRPTNGLRRPLRVGFYRANPATMWDRITALEPLAQWEPRHYRCAQLGLNDLRQGDVDFLVWQTWYGPTARLELELTGLHSQDIAHDSTWAYLGEHHPLAKNDLIDARDLEAYDLIAPAEDLHDLVLRIFAELSVTLKFVHYVDSAEVTDDLLRMTTAIDIAPPSKSTAPGIVRVPLAPAPRTRCALTWRDHPVTNQLGPDLLDLFRKDYVAQAVQRAPGHKEHLLGYSDDFATGLQLTG